MGATAPNAAICNRSVGRHTQWRSIDAKTSRGFASKCGDRACGMRDSSQSVAIGVDGGLGPAGLGIDRTG